MKRSFLSVLSVIFLVPALLACANPADNVPSAGVAAPARALPVAQGEVFEIAEGSTLSFVGSKVTGSHDGGFHGFGGKITMVDGDPLKSTVELSIDTTTLWADNERLTGHLKSPDFFDVETHPSATFTSTAIEPDGEGYKITGNLDLHGVKKSITFPAQISSEAGKVTAQAEFSIMRFEFDIVYPGKPDDLIRDEVVIKLDIVAHPVQGA
jgi:polyisoprenoid-binding protein YceI